MSPGDRPDADPSRYGAEAFLAIPALRSPTISPSHTRVAWRSNETGQPEIWVGELADGDAWQVTDRSSPAFAGGLHLAWLGDDHLVSRKPAHRDGDHVTVRAVDDGSVTRTVPDVPDHGDVRVVGDGRFLLYGWDAGLHRLDLRTAERRQLLEVSQPSPLLPHPAGDWIAFDASHSPSAAQTATCCRLDGSDVTRIAAGTKGARTTTVDWHPHGDGLLVQEVPTDRLGL